MRIVTDSSAPFDMGFQDPASNYFIAMIDLHDNIMFYLIIISTLVTWILGSCFNRKDHLRYLSHGNLIEVIWTLTPAVILWLIGLPSLKLLYIMDEILDAEITVKATAAQWYWQYSYGDYTKNNEGITFDSFMIAEDDLELGEFRKLTVDNALVLPINTSIRMIVTSNDVIHAFAIPSLGIKIDAMPGRLNTIGFTINRETMLFGQCSELCGVLHDSMPIQIKAVNIPSYLGYIQGSL
jgi:cytochrome c oxidase subunit 2